MTTDSDASLDPVRQAIERLPPLRETIAASGLSARKSLGQHFLLDLNLTQRIARAASHRTEGTIVEIGPGPGGLTRALLATGAPRVIAIERDRRCLPALASLVEASAGRLRVVEEDARRIDLESLGPAPRSIVANLPYNVAARLLVRWLAQADSFAEMILMFQREVADRIVATPGSKIYGRLSVICNWCCHTRKLFEVPARAFTPVPKVDAGVVSLTPQRRLPKPAFATLEAVTAAAFGQRRKTLRRALATLPVDADQLLSAAEIDGGRRAETLAVEEFARLARAFEETGAAPDAATERQ